MPETSRFAESPFRLDPIRKPPLPMPVLRGLQAVGAHWTRLSELDALYQQAPPDLAAADFLDHVVGLFDLGAEIDDAALQRIPARGPVVVVANHPFGGLEGVLLARALVRQRPDCKLLVNSLLTRIPELRPLFIGVNTYGGVAARRHNFARLREAGRWLAGGGLLAVFPSGEVARWQPRSRRIADPAWHPHVAALVRRSGATVVPVHVGGRNSLAFHTLGLLHPRLRTAMLARELVNKRHSRVRFTFGRPLAAGDLGRLGDDDQVTAYLRLHTELLGHRGPATPGAAGGAPTGRAGQRAEAVLAAPQDPLELRSEIATLPEECRLLRSGGFSVVCAQAHRFPAVVQELGRLREQSFRLEGEGTGRARDNDGYDRYYEHLVLWDEEAGRIAGAYRLCRADTALARQGPAGLYSHSLFRFPPRLLRRMGPAIELGRSFISPEYQRSYAALLLLWKGIARFVLEQGDCRILFGPVTLSSAYSPTSLRLMMAWLEQHAAAPGLAELVVPRNPVRAPRDWLRGELGPRLQGLDLDGLDRLVVDLEADGKGVPILLRHYLKLGGRVLGFNVDPDFNSSVDGLIHVDLQRTPLRVMNRYMGADAAAAFLHQFGPGPASRPDLAA